MTSPDELVEVLLRRHEILRSLRETPSPRYVLVDSLEASKSTVYKGVSQLQDLDLIESSDEGLRPTDFGLVVLERYEELARTADFQVLLAALPPETVPPAALVGAEAVVPDSHSVDRHFTRVERMLDGADSIRGFSPAISPEYVSIFRNRIVEDGIPVELVLTEEIAIHLREEYPAVVENVLSVDHVGLYVTERELSYTLLLVSHSEGTEFCLEPSVEGPAPGLLVGDSAEGIRWAEAIYERQESAAEGLS